MVEEIISKTKEQAFPTGPVISLENFDSHGGGGENSVAAMSTLTGKELQDSYSADWPEAAKLRQKVSGR